MIRSLHLVNPSVRQRADKPAEGERQEKRPEINEPTPNNHHHRRQPADQKQQLSAVCVMGEHEEAI